MLLLVFVSINSLHYLLTSLLCTVRHYEVVYLIHEDREDEVESVNAKVQGQLSLFIYQTSICTTKVQLLLCAVKCVCQVLFLSLYNTSCPLVVTLGLLLYNTSCAFGRYENGGNHVKI